MWVSFYHPIGRMCGCFILSFPTNHSMKAPSGVLAWFFHQQIPYSLCRIPGGSFSAKRHRQFGDLVMRNRMSNHQPAPDAAMSSCLHAKHHCRGPGEADR